MVAGFRDLVARTRRSGMRVIGSTISPFEGATLAPGFYTPDKDLLRQSADDARLDLGAAELAGTRTPHVARLPQRTYG